ncbi:hypothetical protein GOODEAATRI_000401 [Goodea atripinnis]|uniref:Uncharacterized protein n=1 Tax=Goodea atripinnis TaxID=208336 RepID=A0ABV0PU68_9TELE
MNPNLNACLAAVLVLIACDSCRIRVGKELQKVPLRRGEWRIKCNRAIREMDFTKKKLQQEFDDKLETEQQSKRQDKDTELYTTNVKVQQLEAELHDLSSQESKDEASLAKLKKQLHDLEAKVKDQEEELDEQAGMIQMLEQAKLRLEMEMERQRQTHSKEIESKDEEVEEIRRSCSKKLKQMEVQLEEEYDDKQKVLREKRELESRLLIAQDQCFDLKLGRPLRGL